ncbi:TlpA family protein disulfide reductase [Flavobacterium sp. MK4S-17]|uniref:TlpA family protein disulfide reductase n=1 Tax=Flavobacterium sp. MK4S-17 TaxID=2543737 RepID=UPI00135C6107|nr:TlpA family protein disulfide reductase [Flavobacterium sp. MK4S-17]
MIKKNLILLFTALMLFSCNGKKEDNQKEDVINKNETTEQEVNTEDKPAPKPLQVYSNDSVSVKAYDFSGLEYFLNRDNDTTYVVNFWATWCVPCVEELPHFEKLNKKYRDNKIKVLLVSLDMPKMVESKLLPFIWEKQLKSDVVLLRDPDANSWIPKVDSTWSGAIPATVIYNRNNRKFFERSFTYSELEKEVSLLK